MESDRIIYIAGPITNDPDYYAKFAAVEEHFARQGRIVLNPAKMFLDVATAGLDYKRLLNLCVMTVAHADELALLPNWRKSYGATLEHTAYLTRHKEPYIMHMDLQKTEQGWQADLAAVSDK